MYCRVDECGSKMGFPDRDEELRELEEELYY
jgi:hypothetical protein